MAPQSYAQRVIADGAVNYWRLGEASGLVARDEVGGAHGTINGGVTLGKAGLVAGDNKAMAFDGATGVIVTPPVLLPLVVTVELWCRIAAYGIYKFCFSNRGSPADILIGNSNSNNNLICYSDSAAPPQVTAIPDGVPLGERTHVIVVHTGSVCTFFINAVQNGSYAQVRSGVPVASPIGIGGNPSADSLWPGEIDEVAIYPYALSPAQILAHYQLGLGQFASTPQPSSAASPLVDKPLLAGQAVLGAGAGVDVAGCASLAFTVVGNGAVTAGAVQLEEAHDADFPGAWAAMGAPVTVAAGAKTVKLNQTAKVVRARVSTAIVGGSASVSLVAR